MKRALELRDRLLSFEHMVMRPAENIADGSLDPRAVRKGVGDGRLRCRHCSSDRRLRAQPADVLWPSRHQHSFLEELQHGLCFYLGVFGSCTFPVRPHRQSQTHCSSCHEEHEKRHRCGNRDPILPRELLPAIERARGPGQHRLVVQVPFEIQRQAVGRLVAPGAVFLQALHHDPVEIAANRADEFLLLL